eukprot:Phypoly_transcript_15111.p1 GENE.Phypoly_transcript_15111~~Phypoly_transcript_15111.p1  ORF type:complete len:159 (+),score=7.74 Phypoly_transcript_15111:373-849(+)
MWTARIVCTFFCCLSLTLKMTRNFLRPGSTCPCILASGRACRQRLQNQKSATSGGMAVLHCASCGASFKGTEPKLYEKVALILHKISVHVRAGSPCPRWGTVCPIGTVLAPMAPGQAPPAAQLFQQPDQPPPYHGPPPLVYHCQVLVCPVCGYFFATT